MRKSAYLITGIILGISISIGYSYLNGNKYGTLNQDHQLSNGGLLKKGTKIKYATSFPEGFTQYILYLNVPIWTKNRISINYEDSRVIPHWMEPIDEYETTSITCDSVFEYGEQLPEFTGGASGLLNYHNEILLPLIKESDKATESLTSNFKYSLVISKQGKVLESKILSKVRPNLENMVNKELKNMPNWIAGRVNGKTECMRITIPISCIKWE